MQTNVRPWLAALALVGFKPTGPGKFHCGQLQVMFDGDWLVFSHPTPADNAPRLWKHVGGECRLDLPCTSIEAELNPEEAAGCVLRCLLGSATSSAALSEPPADWFSGSALEADLGDRIARVQVEKDALAFRLTLRLCDSIRPDRVALAEELLAEANRRCRMVRFAWRNGQVWVAADLSGLPWLNQNLVTSALDALRTGARWVAPSLSLFADEAALSPQFISLLTPSKPEHQTQTKP